MTSVPPGTHLHQWYKSEGRWVCDVRGCHAEFDRGDIVVGDQFHLVVGAALPDRQRRVYDVLSDHEWHDGPELTHPAVGGSEGLRRLRELRAKGYVIDMRRKAANRTTRQYRLR